MTPLYALIPLFFYLTGSIPVALITGRALKGIDIRNEGSGNAGAGNSFRVLGPLGGGVVLVLDFLKGLLPVLLLKMYLDAQQAGSSGGSTSAAAEIFTVFCIFCLVAGHAFPVFASFRGGKGAASSAGAVTALVPQAAPLCLAAFLIILILTSYLSLASLTAAWTLPPAYLLAWRAGWTGMSPVYLIFFILAALLITILHRKNIRRLIKGEERKTVFFPSGSFRKKN